MNISVELTLILKTKSFFNSIPSLKRETLPTSSENTEHNRIH